MRPGVRVGVDVGEVRIGLARSDPAGLVATPLETVQRGRDHLARIRAVVTESAAIEVVVGLPRSLSGGEGPSAVKAREVARDIAQAVRPVPVRLCDERLSTVSAEAALRAGGIKSRKQRAVVDQAAAAVILQNALDTERNAGAAPGETLELRTQRD